MNASDWATYLEGLAVFGMRPGLERVGLLCSGDVKASVTELIAASGDEVSTSDSAPIRELMLFALSDAHLEVRMTLGVAR